LSFTNNLYYCIGQHYSILIRQYWVQAYRSFSPTRCILQHLTNISCSVCILWYIYYSFNRLFFFFFEIYMINEAKRRERKRQTTHTYICTPLFDHRLTSSRFRQFDWGARVHTNILNQIFESKRPTRRRSIQQMNKKSVRVKVCIS